MELGTTLVRTPLSSTRLLGARSGRYIEKLDSIAMMLNAWDQVEYTRAFFAEPPIPRRGLPSRPRVDTAVSLRLNASPNWDDALADEFFTY